MHFSESPPNRASGIQKTPTGIDGFDEITGGGLPRERTTLVVGGAGSGKTVFALQFLVNGARLWGEPGIFVAFEESSRQLIENAASFGWDLPALEREKLFFLDARMSADTVKAGNFDLSGLLASLQAKAEEMQARRIVFDSVGVLLGVMGDPLAERQELYRVHDWLSGSGLTGILTARLEGQNLNSLQHYDFLPFMSDCIVLFSQRVEERVSSRLLRVVKFRGSGYAENEFPMVIGKEGIEVGTFRFTQPEYQVSSERISSGVEQLNTMLEGGYFRGSSILVTGSPGTAKSTLAAAFVQASCRRGEPAVYVTFDETPRELIRNMASVGLDLEAHVQAGCLKIHSLRSDTHNAEEHLIQIKEYIESAQPSCLAVDPISAMMKAGGPTSALSVTQRLIHLVKSRGATVLFTSLLEGNDPEVEASELQISTIADTWIHVSYVIQGGERNRAVTIIKSRGTAHSNQVRELVLSERGITLQDVYTAGGAVLMGTLRWEKENAVALERDRYREEIERKRRALAAYEAETLARIETLQHELDARQNEMRLLDREYAELEKEWASREEQLRALRDPGTNPDGRRGVPSSRTPSVQNNQPPEGDS